MVKHLIRVLIRTHWVANAVLDSLDQLKERKGLHGLLFAPWTGDDISLLITLKWALLNQLEAVIHPPS